MLLTEAQEQEALFVWTKNMAWKYPGMELLYAIPNGGSRHPAEARHLKAQGVKPGVPDMFLPVARHGYHGLYIELKRRRGGRVSAEQKAMLDELNKQGYKAVVCEGYENAIGVIIDYLKSVGEPVKSVQPF